MILITAMPARFATAVKRPLCRQSGWSRGLRSLPSVQLPLVTSARPANHGVAAQHDQGASVKSSRKFRASVLHSSPAGAAGVVRANSSGPTSRAFQTSAPSRASLAAVEQDDALHYQYEYTEGMHGDALYGPRPRSWWTGKQPLDCPGVWADGKISSLPQLRLQGCTKQALLDYFDNTWTITEVLFSALQGEEAFTRPPGHALRHPMIFYYGHPAALYVNKLRVAGLLKDPVNPYFESIFETGVDEMSWDDLSKNHMEWPSVAEVHAYRRVVYDLVRKAILSAPDKALATILHDSPYWALPMAFEHERIHIETSSVLMREMPLQYLDKPAAWPEVHPSAQDKSAHTYQPVPGRHYPENVLIEEQGGQVTLGKPRDFPSFGWDNEYGSRTYNVQPFAANKYMVTNGEFLEFVKDGGYARQELWTEDGWGWRTFRNVKKPTFWEQQGPSGLHQYGLRTMFSVVPMPWSWPADVCFHEAKAFANWRSQKDGARQYRVMTELEHHVMREGSAEDQAEPEARDPVLATAGRMYMDAQANLNLSWGSESPVDALGPNSKGYHDVSGNVWQWCEDHLSALQGFRINPLYEDFSTPCFDGQHHVIKGGSFASTGNEASVYARFHFRPHFYQHAGFRLVSPVSPGDGTFATSCTDAPGPYVGTYPFRTSDPMTSKGFREASRRLVQEGLAAHYLSAEHLSPAMKATSGVVGALQYPKRCAQLLQRFLPPSPGGGTVLDVGCGTGGAAFELARTAQRVMALDASRDCIEAATELQKSGRIIFPLVKEGQLLREVSVELDSAIDVDRIVFKQGDPMCLPPEFASFDAVLIHSVLDRVASPNGVLGRMGGARGVVKPGGLLMVVSAYDWNSAATPTDGWLGGFKDADGNEVASMQGIAKALGQEFKLVHQEDVPCAVAQNERKLDLVLLHATVWKRD